jgi:hypothetical protein
MNYEYDNLTHRELADRVITINTKSGYIPNLALTPSPSPKLGRGEPEPEAMAGRGRRVSLANEVLTIHCGNPQY